MRNPDTEVAYEVTVSDELRVLLGARRLPEAGPWDHAGAVVGAAPASPVGVFRKRRLRRDGGRPVTVSASEILTLRAGETAAVPGEPDGRSDGHLCLSILLTDEGACIAHVVARPAAGSAARPVHRLRRIEGSGDILAVLRDCRSDLDAYGALLPASVRPGASPDRPRPLSAQSAQVAEALAPFVETSC